MHIVFYTQPNETGKRNVKKCNFKIINLTCIGFLLGHLPDRVTTHPR